MKLTINICIEGIPVGTDIEINGKPYSETVPDEKTPPEHIFKEEPEQTGVETVFPTDFAAPAEEPVEEFKPVKRGPRGPYKKKADEPPPAKYLSLSTIELIKQGNELNMPGIQASKKKFIVEGAYIQGRVDEARDLYRKYLKEGIENESFDILTWGSWIARKYNKNT